MFQYLSGERSVLYRAFTIDTVVNNVFTVAGRFCELRISAYLRLEYFTLESLLESFEYVFI